MNTAKIIPIYDTPKSLATVLQLLIKRHTGLKERGLAMEVYNNYAHFVQLGWAGWELWMVDHKQPPHRKLEYLEIAVLRWNYEANKQQSPAQRLVTWIYMKCRAMLN